MKTQSGRPISINRRGYRRMDGFNLVELMVSITIGLIILAAVSAVFVSSKRTYSTQDRLARLQENARFAIQYITRDLRMAGYSGCMDEVSSVNSTLNNSFVFNASTPIEGLENATGNWYPSGTASTIPTGMRSGTDAVMIRMADPSLLVNISSPMPNQSAEMNVSSVTGLNENDIIMVSDCSSADVMQITAVQTAALKIQHNPGGTAAPGNATQQLGKQYKPPAQLMKFTARLYYTKTGADGSPALWVQENGTDQELVEDVEDFQITYGVDTDTPSDGVPNSYRKPGDTGLSSPADWARVKSVRIGLLVRAPNDKDVDTDIKPSYDVNGKTFTVSSGDKYQRRVFLTTVQLRNN